MAMVELTAVLIKLAAWSGVTAGIAIIFNYLLKKTILSPWLWWLGLLMSTLILLPMPESIITRFGELTWVMQSESLVTSQVTSNVLPKLDNELLKTHGLAIFWVVISLVSLWRVVRMYRNYQRVYQLVLNHVPYYSKAGKYPIFLTPFKRSAFAIGLVRPVIALPDYFLSLSEQQQLAVIAHEQTHLLLGDHQARMAWRIIVEFFWFNPFLILLEKGFSQSMEYRCDEQTLKKHDLAPVDYGQALLECLKMGGASDPRSAVVGFCTQGASFKDYKRRVTLIIKRPAARGHLKLISLVVTAVMSLILSVNSALAAFWYVQEDWIYPVANPRLTSGFGHIAKLRAFKPHQGIDLRGPAGTPIYASASGKVMIADQTTLSSGYGQVIVLQHIGQWQSLYAHLDRILVAPGQMVKQGEIIGLMGETGRASGVHLHFELAHEGKPVDPLNHIPNEYATESLMR